MKNLSLTAQAIQAEQALIGSILKDSTVLSGVAVRVTEDCFCDPRNKLVWESFINLERDGKAIDVLTVFQDVRSVNREIDVSPAYLIECQEKSPVSQNMEYYANAVMKNYGILETRRILNTHLQLLGSVDPRRVSAQLQVLADNLEYSEGEAFMDWGTVGKSLVEKLRSGKPLREGYLKQSAYPKLDEMAPLHKGELCVIGAITSGGKTAFTVKLCIGLASEGARGLYFFYESTAENIQLRVASIMTRTPLNRLSRSQLTEDEIDRVDDAMKLINDELSYRDESRKGAIDDLIVHVKSKLKKASYDYIVIDHMHQMPIAGRIREGFIDITNKFLQLAKQENIAVIALAQFRKPNEREADKRPTANLIRESSTISQDAHHVWFLHDPAHLAKKRREQIEEFGTGMAGRYGGDNTQIPEDLHAEIIVDKNREGETGIIPARFHRDCVLWEEI